MRQFERLLRTASRESAVHVSNIQRLHAPDPVITKRMGELFLPDKEVDPIIFDFPSAVSGDPDAIMDLAIWQAHATSLFDEKMSPKRDS